MSREPSVRLGSTGFFFLRRPVRLPVSQAKTHYHVIGVSGSGKSRFLASLYLEFLAAGLAGTLLDPHGDLARLTLGKLVERGYFGHPGTRNGPSGGGSDPYHDLIYLDLPTAERRGLYVPMDVLRQPGPPDAIAANIMDAMHRTWHSLAGGAAPRFDSFIQYGIPVLLANDLPLPALPRLIADKPFRDACLQAVADADLVAFWQGWYDRLAPRLQLEYVDSTLSRIRLLTRAPVLRYSLAQAENLLAWRALFDAGRSVIINLALQNQDAQKLLGALLMVGAEQGAQSRADTPDAERGPDHMLIADEFPNFLTRDESAAIHMLSQTRKYGLHLILAHQNFTQASENLRGAMQNAPINVTFAVGREDAEASTKILSRVDPRTRSHRDDVDTEGVGIREQWEAFTQDLVDQLQGRATLRLPGNRKHRWEVWKSWTARTLAVKTMTVENPRVDREVLARIEEAYLARYFVSAERIDAALASPAPAPAPAKPRSGLSRTGSGSSAPRRRAG